MDTAAKIPKLVKRFSHLDLARILAICFVIVLHTSGQFWSVTDVHSYRWVAANVYDGLSRCGVDIFVLISGALFLHPGRKVTIRSIYTKNIFQILVVFFIWSAIYLLLNIHRLGWSSYSTTAAINELLRGHYHMWFLAMIIGLYMITPLLRKITEHEKSLKYATILAMVFGILIPSIQTYLQLLSELTYIKIIDFFSGVLAIIIGGMRVTFPV